MPTRVLVVYYSVHGHVETLARAVGEGAGSVRNTDVRLRRVRSDDGPRQHAEDEATIDDMRWADGIAWGTPTRYGVMATADAVGGSPYGPSTVAGPDGQRSVADVELTTARNLGARIARVASALKIVRVTRLHGRDVDAPAYETRVE